MTGLSVLYAKEAAEEREWAAIPDRDRTGRLREVYWACRAELKSGRKSFTSVNLKCRANRTEIGRRRDDPGDGFIYLVDMTPRVEDRFEWLEVTEVFTTVPALRIEGAMRAWNGIADKQPVDFDEFRKGLRRGRPSRMEQRRAADQVIAQIERKLAKTSYHELLERYGYGTLVVGMPLWFAVPPDDPFRAENAVDDFMTRTTLGLEDVSQRALRRRDCPFRNVIVIWDTTPQALREWRKRRCAEYDDAANTSLENPMPASFWGVLSGALEKAVSKTATPEREAPSMCLRIPAKAASDSDVKAATIPGKASTRRSEAALERLRERIGKGALHGKDNIGVRAGKVLNKYKVGKHFTLDIGDAHFEFAIDPEKVAAEAALDGIYVIRTSLPPERIGAADAVRGYKALTQVERAFRSFKTIGLKVRPIRHYRDHRVRAHIFLCMLAYYVQWHMMEAWRPLLFADEDQAAKTLRDPVAPAQRSESALRKVHARTLDDDSPVHSFQTLLDDLGGIVRNLCRRKGAGSDEPAFEMTTPPNPTQARAYQLLKTIAM